MPKNWCNTILISFLIFCLFPAKIFGQSIQGIVLDDATKQPFPGVVVKFNQNSFDFLTTDENGTFKIPSNKSVEFLEFSFLGYKTVRYSQKQLAKISGKMTIYMVEEKTELLEVEIEAGESPANRIIRNVIAFKDSNNPKKLDSYSYRSYNKNIIKYNLDSIPSETDQKEKRRKKKDRVNAETRYLMVIESVTRKKYLFPNISNEVVVGSRISGLQNPKMGMVPTDIAHFGFHDEYLPLMDKKFLNPIADIALSRYSFIMKDTLKRGKDSIFVIGFFPKRGSNFDGLKGDLHINTDRWAIEYVTARPHETGKIDIYIEQFYAKPDGIHWFPQQLNFQLALEKFPFRKEGAIVEGKTFIDSVIINKPLDKKEFVLNEVDIQKDAGKVRADFWERERKEQLSKKEKTTYKVMDAWGKRHRSDMFVDMFRNAYKGYMSFGYVDADMMRFVAGNDYEGLRLGLGLYTNDWVSDRFVVGGYAGYGNLDKEWKYGGHFEYTFHKESEFKFSTDFKRDLRSPGSIELFYFVRTTIANQFFSTFMDKYNEESADISFRAYKFHQVKTGVRHRYIAPTYSYAFLGTGEPQTSFDFSEVFIEWRWLHGERFLKNFGQRISRGSKFPIVLLNYSRGFKNFINGDFDYNRLQLGIQYNPLITGHGQMRMNFEMGLIDKSIPAQLNFMGRPSFNPSFSIVLNNTFQTMRFNEFASSSYGSFFFSHTFNGIRMGTPFTKPQPSLYHAMSWGSIVDRDDHIGLLQLKSLEKGYFETGLLIDHLIRVNMNNAGYLGFGLAAFYRYGANHLPVERDNWTYKFSIKFSVN